MKAMKTTKKLFALVLALVMAMALSVTASAADGDSYTITVKNAAAGATYNAYKIFDATATSDGTAVSYTIPSGSDIAGADGFSGVFTTTTNGGLTYVTRASGVTDEQVTTWLKGYIATLTDQTAAGTVTNSNNASTVSISVDEQGYYYVTTTTGTAVSITTVAKDVEINDKNDRTPSIDETTGKQVATSENGDYSSTATMQVGDTAYFKITFTATNYVVEDGESTQITEYTVTDTPDGFDIDSDSVVVKVGDTTLSSDTGDYTASVDQDGVLTVVISWDDEYGNTIYGASETVVVTYTATLTDDNLAAASTNKAEIKYNQTTLPTTPEVKVYNYTIAIDKYDEDSSETKLAGAKFVLKNSDGKFYKVDAATGYVTWVVDQSEATEVATDSNGSASFAGLAAGTYYLVETEAPAGYNLLGSPVEITLDEAVADTVLTVAKSVANSSGSLLPSTGGTGTTVIYIVGALLVIGAGVVLVVRRRMNAE